MHVKPSNRRRFVIQKHNATRLHYDGPMSNIEEFQTVAFCDDRVAGSDPFKS